MTTRQKFKRALIEFTIKLAILLFVGVSLIQIDNSFHSITSIIGSMYIIAAFIYIWNKRDLGINR